MNNLVLKRLTASKVFQQKRYAGGFFRKNIRVEENAGIRESSYKTWKFSASGFVQLTAYMIVPFSIIYWAAVGELNAREQSVGGTQPYGIIPPKKWRSER